MKQDESNRAMEWKAKLQEKLLAHLERQIFTTRYEEIDSNKKYREVKVYNAPNDAKQKDVYEEQLRTLIGETTKDKLNEKKTQEPTITV